MSTGMGRRELAPGYTIFPILNGMWQCSGGHGKIDPNKAVKEMVDYVNAGYTTFDLADHYGPAEDLIGAFRERNPTVVFESFTKWVPRAEEMTRAKVEAAIDRSLARMKTNCLDMLQFHWWDYGHRGYLDAMRIMGELQTEGKIKYLSLTNFDTEHMARIVDSGVALVSNQVSYSIVDTRPEKKMVEYCVAHNIKLLTYGTLLGGFISDKYLGVDEPNPETTSQRKYLPWIRQWGGWELFQELLRALRAVADKHNVSIANVAVKWVLDKPAVGGVIVGTRLSIAEHRDDNLRTMNAQLDDADRESIAAVLAKSTMLPGDCGDEYRR